MQVCLMNRSAQTIVRAATLKRNLQIKLSISTRHKILTRGRPVPALTPKLQTGGKVVSGALFLKRLVCLDLEKIQDESRTKESNPGLPVSRHTPLPLGQRGGQSNGTGAEGVMNRMGVLVIAVVFNANGREERRDFTISLWTWDFAHQMTKILVTKT